MRNFFVRNYISYTCLILVSFCIAGITFFVQINKFSFKEKQDILQTSASHAADLTGMVLSNYSTVLDKLYQINLKQLSQDNNISIIITTLNGNIILVADAASNMQSNIQNVHPLAVQQVMVNNHYSEMGTFSGVFAEPNYILGKQCIDNAGNIIALAFVATSANAVIGLLRDVMESFFLIVFISLIITLIMSYFIAGKMTYPLKIIASAAGRFARGDFDVRVPEDNHCNEIDELAVSFNNMAGSLQELEELSRGFVANVSHDLKTPMTSIGGFVDGMLDGTIPKEKHDQYLSVISEEVKRLSRLIVRMLDAAKLQSGELILNPTDFNICEVATRIILSFENQINDRNIDINLTLCDRLMVNGDEDHIFRVIYNLIDNAVKFTDNYGKISMSIYTENNTAYFSISNTGAQISESEISHVFDRFYKADLSRSHDKTGAGLGLYIVKSIVNLHHGDISVSSFNNITEFSFTLPIKYIKDL